MKHVVLTGASGGIGQACLEAFLKRGCRVFAVDRDPAPVKSLVEARGWQEAVEVFQTDLREVSQIEDLVKTIGNLWDCVDVLVNNAGIVNLSSWAAGRPHLNASPVYGATKAAIVYLTRHWALEWVKNPMLCYRAGSGPDSHV